MSISCVKSAAGLSVHWGGVYDRSELQAILAAA